MTDDEPPTAARAVIADDERLMRDQLRSRLAEAWPALQVVGEARHGQEAVDLVAALRPDVVFLDIRMPGLDGVEAARQIVQLPPSPEEAGDAAGAEIVFVTAYDEYAVQAFERGAVDYVLKPAEPARLALTARRVAARLRSRRPPEPGHADGAAPPAGEAPPPLQALLQQLSAHLGRPPRHLAWIQANVGATVQMIPVDDVLFFISDEKYTRVQTATQEALIRKPIKELVDELDPGHFWQIHRSTLVNVRAIAGVVRDLRGRQLVCVKGRPEKLEVSRGYAGLFKGM